MHKYGGPRWISLKYYSIWICLIGVATCDSRDTAIRETRSSLYEIAQDLHRGLAILESYRRMAREKVAEKLVDKILKSRLSLKVLPD